MALIENIREILNNVGVVYNYQNKNDSRLAVNDRQGLLYLIDNVFEIYPLLTTNQRNRYNLLKTTLMNGTTHFKTLEGYEEYKSTFMLSNSVVWDLVELYESGNLQVDNWIIGFINGEGCFYLNKGRCSFMIEHTDKNALDLIKHRLNIGPSVLERSARSRDEGKARKTTYQLNISSPAGPAIFVTA